MEGPLVHAFPNGTVAVKMHKRKRLTMVVAREEEVLVERIEALEHENRVLRRRISELTQ
jgi:chaperonin cofactor prefoldin